MVTFSTAQPQTVDYKVVHQNARRIRVCIPRLAVDGKYAHRLKCLVESIGCISDVRLNTAASSLAVEYDYEVDTAAVATAVQKLFWAIQQAVKTQPDNLTPANSNPPQTQPSQKYKQVQVHFQVIHVTKGRIRIGIPRLIRDAKYASQLQRLTQSLDFITSVRINPYASSLIVHYEVRELSTTEIFERLEAVIQQAAFLPLPQIPVETSAKLSANLNGVGWMLLSTGAFAGMQAAIRYVSGSIHPFEIVFLSHLFSIVVLSPWLADLNTLKTEKLHLHVLRAVIDTGATLLLFVGLSLTPLAQANALGFTAPLFAMLGAVLFLGERMQPHNWVALLLGVVGTLVILRPGLEIAGLGSVLLLLGSAALSGVLLLLKVLSKTESSLTSNAYTALLVTPLTLFPALLVWQWPTLIELFWLVVVAVLMTGGHMAVAQAFQEAEVTTVLPVEFAQLLWASGLGYLLFAEVPDLWIWVGGLLIFVGSISLVST